MANRLIRGDAARLAFDPTGWHDYVLEWRASSVTFLVDGATVFETGNSPRGPLGFVFWIDNQFAAFTPQGNLKWGTLASEMPASLQTKNLQIERLDG
jgi:hypothetical protein